MNDDFSSDDYDYLEDEYDAERPAGGSKKQQKARRRKKRDISGADAEPDARGLVVSVQKQRCKVAVDGSLVTAWLTADVAAEQQRVIAVGDEVTLEKRDHDFVVLDVLPRRTTLSRADPGSPETERVVAANVDLVVVVSAAIEPPLRTGLIDRYLVAIARGGAAPVVCINKIDQADDQERARIEEIMEDYRRVGIPVVFCSTVSGQGIDRLRNEVSGKTAVLVGHSGVGKSSLLLALDAELRVRPGELHRQGRSGRHTTTSSTLYEFADGTRLIDTPGIREFGLFELDAGHLRAYFSEFDELATSCRYRNCTHTHEIDCAVRDAAARGELPRYERYLALAREL